MRDADYEVIVIGAGIAGLVAAYRLTKAGLSVKILEAGEVPGGRVGDREVNGIRFNSGARLIYPFSPNFNRLLRELGLADSLVKIQHLSAECVGNGESWNVELMPGLASFLTPGLTFWDRLRFLPYGLSMLVNRFRTNPDDATTALSADAETLSDYISCRMGPRVLRRMVAPIFRGARSWNPEEVSGAFFASTTPHLLGRTYVCVPKGGMSELPEALARGLDVSCNTWVEQVQRSEAGIFTVTFNNKNGGQRLSAKKIVMAVEGDRVPSILQDMTVAERRFFDSVKYNPLGIVHYKLNRNVPAKMSFFDGEEGAVIATYQQIPGDSKSGQAPQLYAQLSPEMGAQAQEKGQEKDLHGLVVDRVRQLYPEFDVAVSGLHEQWIERMLPVFYPGYAAKVRAFLEERGQGTKNVYFCGDYLAQSLLTGAAASGEKTAMQLLQER
jgi:protoporphyrinogen/coproporphyrinogen III oxidase